MTNKLNKTQIDNLLEALVDTPRWHGETNADRESVDAIDTWGYIASVAVQKLTDAFDSTDSAPEMNFSAMDIRSAVRGQIDSLKDFIPEADDDEQ